MPRREASSFVLREKTLPRACWASPTDFLVLRDSCVWNFLQAASLPRVMRKATRRSLTCGLDRERTEIRDRLGQPAEKNLVEEMLLSPSSLRTAFLERQCLQSSRKGKQLLVVGGCE